MPTAPWSPGMDQGGTRTDLGKKATPTTEASPSSTEEVYEQRLIMAKLKNPSAC